MFHIVHSPRFTLLAPMKLTFDIGTSDQTFGPCGASDKQFWWKQEI